MSSYLHDGDVVATVSDDSAGGGSVVVFILMSEVNLSGERRGFVHTLLQMLYQAGIHPECVSKGCSRQFVPLIGVDLGFRSHETHPEAQCSNALMVSLGLRCMFITASIVAMRFFCDV